MREAAPKLWIGNALEARHFTVLLNAGVEAIVDLALEELPICAPRELVYCRIPMIDGAGNPPSRIRIAVETISKLVASDIPTLVACNAGMSRSPAFVAAVLVRLKGIALGEALSQIGELGPCDVSPALLADIANTMGKNQP